MKMLKSMCACLMGLFLMGCSSDNEENVVETSPEFSVVSMISPLLRAPQLDASGAGQFVTGDKNTLFFQTAEHKALQTFVYTYGSTYHWSDIKLPQEVKECGISACYPEVQTENPAQFRWDIRQQGENSDFLVAAPVSVVRNTNTPVHLQFRHAMHKLMVELTAKEGVSQALLDRAVISCRNFKPVAVLDLLEGKAASAEGELSSQQSDGKSASFVLPAQEVGGMEVAVKVDGRDFVTRLADCKIAGTAVTSLESGKTLLLRIEVGQESFSVSGQNIAGWGEQGSIDDTIIL